jgi:uncharacterized membrane protein YfcA
MTFTLVLIAFVLTLAGAVKGLFGMGLPTVSMGLLGLMMSPLQAATLLVVPTLLSNVWQLSVGPSLRPLSMRFVWLMITMALGTAIGIGFLTSTSPLVPMALGAVLAIYGLVGLFAAHFVVPAAHERWLSPAIGLISGVVNGATGISAIPLVPYLNSLGLTRDELIQSLGLLFTASIIALSACLAWTDHLHVESMSASALTCIPVFIGMVAGQAIRTKLHADTFRRWFFIGLIVIGVYMAGKALFAWYLPA